MHSGLSVTDGIYGILSSADVGKRISGLGEKLAVGDSSQDEIIGQMSELLEMLKKSSGVSGIK